MKVSIFGESHGTAIGVLIEGIPSGIELNYDDINLDLERRSARKHRNTSTGRHEKDEFKILSGVYNGMTTGTPLCAVIENLDTRSADYDNLKKIPRPGHGDYTGYIKYKGYNDPRGGGHFSGRLTAPLVMAGGICKTILEGMGVSVAARIMQISSIIDDQSELDVLKHIDEIRRKDFPVINNEAGVMMVDEIKRAAGQKDSLGGIIECCIKGIKPGIGEPGQGSIESIISKYIFAVPAVKGIEFGVGFHFAQMKGSEGNDAMYSDNSKVMTYTNNNGGILGGISNGMPIVFRTVIKPTPSIGIKQKSVDLSNMENTELSIEGRHDPCIVPRAVPVIESAAAIALCEIMV